MQPSSSLVYSDPTGGRGVSIHQLSQICLAAGMHPDKVAKFAYSIADVHVDSFLSNFSIDYHVPENLIADIVMPVVQVDKASNKYPVWARADANKIVDAKVGPRDFPAEIYQTLSSATYTTEPRAIWSPVPNDLLAAADAPLDLMGVASRDVRAALMKSREKRVADIVMNASNYTYTTTLSGNNRWDVGYTASTADPLNDILTYMDRAAVKPNLLVFGQLAWTAFRKHPRVVSSIMGMGITGAITGRIGTMDEISGLLGGVRIAVGDAKYRSSADFATETYDWVWGKGIAGLYVSPGNTLNTLSWGKTFRHIPMEFSTIYDQRPGMRGVTYIKGAHSDAEVVTAPAAGFYIASAVS